MGNIHNWTNRSFIILLIVISPLWSLLKQKNFTKTIHDVEDTAILDKKLFDLVHYSK